MQLIEKKQRHDRVAAGKSDPPSSATPLPRGFDPNAKLKHSGIKWSGEIPEHWEAIRLQFCCEVPSGQVRGQRHLMTDTEVSFVPMEAVSEYGDLNLDQTIPDRRRV